MSRTRLLILLGCLTVIAAGCGGDSTTEASAELGHYTLVSVNGQPLPFTIPQTTSGSVVIQSATIDLTSGTNGQLSYAATVTGLASGQGPRQLVGDRGSYTKSGSAINFSSTLVPGITYTGTVVESTLSVTLPGALFGGTGSLVIALKK
jgi:hypothetical protein